MRPQCPGHRAGCSGELPHRRGLGGCRPESAAPQGRAVRGEAALCSRIVYGVMQDRLLLDFYLGSYCSQKIDHLQPPLAEILRIGAYQILFLDKVPDSAAVNQAVEQAKANGRAKASGLVNAVLRQVSRNKNDLPLIPDRDEVQYLSIRYSHPKWLVKRLLALLDGRRRRWLSPPTTPRRP